MRTVASQSIILFLLFNIMFLTRIHAKKSKSSFGLPDLPDLGMASAPTPEPVNPGMAPATNPEPTNPGTDTSSPSPTAAPLNPGTVQAPTAAPLDPGMASALGAAPLDPAMAPAPSSGPFDLNFALPPTLANLDLNCSGCPIDPFGLAACGILISGRLSRDNISYCCSTLSSLSREDAEACLCHAIKIETVKIGDLDVNDAINKALVACSKA